MVPVNTARGGRETPPAALRAPPPLLRQPQPQRSFPPRRPRPLPPLVCGGRGGGGGEEWNDAGARSRDARGMLTM